MNVRLALAELHVPAALKRRGLADLLRRCAAAFGAPAPDLTGRPYRVYLQTFVQFTAEQAALTPRDPLASAAVRARLRAAAVEVGTELRRVLRVRTRADGLRAARLVYRLLGIDFAATVSGDIVVRACAFSSVYSPATCALMSALDEGLIAGLAGEGQLEFGKRITEGCARCEATFHFAQAAP